MSKYDITEADFKLFMVLWNQMQNLTTPAHHFQMANWLERRWMEKDLHLLLMAFRSSGKSTIVGLFAAWLLYRQTDLRILVLAADFTLAKKMVRNVKRIIERHPLTAHLVPNKPDQWAGDRFTIKRMMELRDPSMIAKGVASNITGSRADIILCDDVEVPNTCDTAEKRAELRNKLAELSYVLVPGGTQLYIGTPHNYYTIYAKDARKDAGEDVPFLNGFERLEIPVLNKAGESVWPDRFNHLTLDHMKRHTGPNKFASQMMLQPVNIAEGRLNPDLLRVYNDELDYTKELQTLFLGKDKLVSASAFWDPAFGSAKGDRSVLAILFTNEKGQVFLHHVEYIDVLSSRPRQEPSGGISHLSSRSLDYSQDDEMPQDEATQQCRIVAGIAKAHYLPSLTVEINGIGRFLPNILRNELARAKAPCRVNEIANSRPKDIRILEAFDTVLAAQRLSVHERVLQTPFMTEMREWHPGGSRGHDDGLDAVAGALAQKPLLLERIYGKGSHSWMRSGRPGKAKTDFEV